MTKEQQRERGIFAVSPERRRLVRDDIADGSEPGIRFYLMVVISTMIASFGLITNSTAVIIGAMLVAPLMTPIFGMSLALIRSDTHLFGRAVQAEIVGVVAAVLMGFILGSLYPGLEPTSEMLARTKPQLFDLLVAVFSGFAGAYALVDEKISPALPGVAIATAIVPPLANTGLCFSLGAYAGGVGSFLLFFSNFLSILLIGAIVFWIFRMTRRYDRLKSKVIIKRFSLPIIGFFIIAAFLSHSLYTISRERMRKNYIEETLSTEIAKLPSTSFEGAIYHEEDDRLYVLAKIDSSSTISPYQVSRLQDSLEMKFEQEVELTVRSAIAETVSSLDNFSQVTGTNLDGSFISKNPRPLVLKTKIADSTIRSYLVDLPGVRLKLVRIVRRDEKMSVVATIHGLIPPRVAEIRKLENLLRERLEVPSLELVIQFLKTQMYNRDGKYHFEISGIVDLTPEQKEIVDKVKPALRHWFAMERAYLLENITHILIGKTLHFYLETTGTKIFAIETVYELERRMKTVAGQEVKLHVKSDVRVIATSNGYESYEDFANEAYISIKPKLKEDMRKIIENSSM